MYMFLNIFNKHASLLLCDTEYFELIFGPPTLHSKLDAKKMNEQYDKNDTIVMEAPLLQFHLAYDGPSQKYMLTFNLYYLEWMRRGVNFCLGRTGLSLLHFQLQSLLSVHKQYSVLESDCLSFVLSVAKVVVEHEQQATDPEQFEVFAKNLTVTNIPLESFIRGGRFAWITDLLRKLF